MTVFDGERHAEIEIGEDVGAARAQLTQLCQWHRHQLQQHGGENEGECGNDSAAAGRQFESAAYAKRRHAAGEAEDCQREIAPRIDGPEREHAPGEGGTDKPVWCARGVR